ncbi:uncharacterized protein [Centruroides vittatus]|uniref:uncharacterized protein n=1 Tax=Centruroides vittatus TaxID=120091 RepID=UPI00350F866B
MRDGIDDCLLFYKPQGTKCEEYLHLSESDFALAIMNDDETAQRLYCSWHVDCAWCKNLCKIKSKEKKTEVYKIIQSLMQGTDKETFKLISATAVIKLVDDHKTTDFGQYFKENYMKTNHSMHKGKVTRELSDLRKRHKTSLSLCKDLDIKEDNIWKIPSSNGSDIYTIAMHMKSIDTAVKFNMCKHILLVCQLKAESVSKQCEGQQGELLIWENNDERKKEVLLDHLSKNINNDEPNTLNTKVELKRKNALCQLDDMKKIVENLQFIEEFKGLNRLLNP